MSPHPRATARAPRAASPGGASAVVDESDLSSLSDAEMEPRGCGGGSGRGGKLSRSARNGLAAEPESESDSSLSSDDEPESAPHTAARRAARRKQRAPSASANSSSSALSELSSSGSDSDLASDSDSHSETDSDSDRASSVHVVSSGSDSEAESAAPRMPLFNQPIDTEGALRPRGAARRAAAALASTAGARGRSASATATASASADASASAAALDVLAQRHARAEAAREAARVRKAARARQAELERLTPRERRKKAREDAAKAEKPHAATGSGEPAAAPAPDARAKKKGRRGRPPKHAAAAAGGERVAETPEPEVELTAEQRAAADAAKAAALAERARRREEKKAELEAKKEVKRQERAAYLAYRRQLREEAEAEERAAMVVDETDDDAEGEQRHAGRKRKASAREREASSGEESSEEEEAGAGRRRAKRRSKKMQKLLGPRKKDATPPLQIPDYLALGADARSKACLQDVRPAYFYPDKPYVPLEEWDEDAVPVFEPSMEQFEDFYAYMTAIDAWGMRSGIVKVIPPKEWVAALPSIRRADVLRAAPACGLSADDAAAASLEGVRVRSAIEQNFTQAGSGVWRATNVVKPNKVWNAKLWADEAAKPARRGPQIKHMQAKLAEATASATSRATGAPAEDVMGARTRSGKIVDGENSRAVRHAQEKEAAKKKRMEAKQRKREALEAEAAAVAQAQAQAAAKAEAEAAAQAAAQAQAAFDSEMPPLESVPAPAPLSAAAAPGGSSKDGATATSSSTASDRSRSPASTSTGTGWDQHAAIEHSSRSSVPSDAAHSPRADETPHPHGKEAQAQAPPASAPQQQRRQQPHRVEASEGEDSDDDVIEIDRSAFFRKRVPSVPAKEQPSLRRPLEAAHAGMRSASAVPEESHVLRRRRDHDLTGEKPPAAEDERPKRPEWHPKKITVADKTSSEAWAAFDFQNCWLQEAASVVRRAKEKDPAAMDTGADGAAGEEQEEEEELVVPSAKDWTPEICRQIEGEYWRGLNGGVPPMYGADQEGTLFTPRTKSWNVGALDNILTRLRLQGRLPGVTTPYLYLGMWRATFAWHVEDMDLYSINYIHFGAPKQWYAIRQFDRQRFENIMRAAFPQDSGRCSQFMRHKSYLASPNYLRERGVEPLRLTHHAQEFVITYPFGYHSGYNLGFNCAESVNFALESWLDIGRKANYCHCVDFSVRVDVDALIEESNEIVEAEEAAERARLEEEARMREEDAAAEAEAAAENAQEEADAAEIGESVPHRPALITSKEKLHWHREGLRIMEERQAIVRSARTDGDLDELAQRAMELRKADAAYKDFQARLAAQNKQKRSEAQIMRNKRIADEKERMLAEERAKAEQECPCVFCLSRNTADLVPIKPAADAPPGEPVKRAHRSCIPLIDETYIPVEGPDVVLGFENIPKDRWKLKCGICKVQYGCCAQCTYGKCAASAHISCAFPDEAPTYEKEMPSWLYQSLPVSEARVMNGHAKKVKKPKKVKAQPAPAQQPPAPVAPQLALQQPGVPGQSAQTMVPHPSAPSQAQPDAGMAALQQAAALVQAGGMPSQPGHAHAPEATAPAVEEEEPQEEEYTHVFLCPTHNPEWKKIVAERRAAKKLEENRQRVLSLPPGTLIKYRSKGGGVWQSPMIKVVDKEDGTEGEVIVSEQNGPASVAWSRIIFPEGERSPGKRKFSAAPSEAGDESVRRVKASESAAGTPAPVGAAAQSSPASSSVPYLMANAPSPPRMRAAPRKVQPSPPTAIVDQPAGAAVELSAPAQATMAALPTTEAPTMPVHNGLPEAAATAPHMQLMQEQIVHSAPVPAIAAPAV